MLAYWTFASLVTLELLQVPPEWMYSDYENPLVRSWNWSFLPLDVIFALTGLYGRYATLKPQTAHSTVNLLAIADVLRWPNGYFLLGYRRIFQPVLVGN